MHFGFPVSLLLKHIFTRFFFLFCIFNLFKDSCVLDADINGDTSLCSEECFQRLSENVITNSFSIPCSMCFVFWNGSNYCSLLQIQMSVSYFFFMSTVHHWYIYIYLAAYDLLLFKTEAHILLYVLFFQIFLLLWSSHLQVLVPLRHSRKRVKKNPVLEWQESYENLCAHLPGGKKDALRGSLGWLHFFTMTAYNLFRL